VRLEHACADGHGDGTSTPTVKVVTFNPAASGSLLAGKIAAKEKTAGIDISGVECKNFPNIKVGTYADCRLRVNGVKQGCGPPSHCETVITNSRLRS
jgi:hypothetical protein